MLSDLADEKSEYTAAPVVLAVRHAFRALHESIGDTLSLLLNDFDDTPALEDVLEYVHRGDVALELLSRLEGEMVIVTCSVL